MESERLDGFLMFSRGGLSQFKCLKLLRMLSLATETKASADCASSRYFVPVDEVDEDSQPKLALDASSYNSSIFVVASTTCSPRARLGYMGVANGKRRNRFYAYCPHTFWHLGYA